MEITSATCGHGENCRPGKQNRITTGQRSGQYVVTLPSNSLFTLCNFLKKKWQSNKPTYKAGYRTGMAEIQKYYET